MSNIVENNNLAQYWAEFCQLPVSSPAISELGSASMQKDFQTGETVFFEGERSDSLFLISEGKLRVVRFTENGHEIWLSDLVANDLVGELSIFTGEKRTATINAVEPTTGVLIPVSEFEMLMQKHAAIAFALAGQLARRLKATSNHLSELASMPLQTRLHAELIRSGAQDVDDKELWIVSGAPTVTEIGERITQDNQGF